MSAVVTLLLSSVTFAQPPETGDSIAGWYDLFPPFNKSHQPVYMKPVVVTKNTYSQTVRFGAPYVFELSFNAKVARDPDFKKRYSKDAMKDAPVEAVVIGRRTAWVWDNEKVIVPLGDDKAVLLEVDPNSFNTAL